jgi:multidrug efflux pump subunit AcrA (membrane-fusion protein)
MFGYTVEEFLKLGVRDIHPPEEVDKDLQRFQAVAEGRVSMNEERPCLKKDGSVFYADISGHPIVYEGRPCTLAVLRDVTERRQAQAALRDTELHAPFAGTVVTLDTRVGEQVSPTAAVANIADLSSWDIETTNLTEINIPRVREGATAKLSFDALPDVELNGKVSRTRALGENKQGDIVYVVTIVPDKQDPRLRWNMTTQVNIQPQS